MEHTMQVYIPETLYEANLAFVMVFDKVMKIENLSDREKIVQLVANLNDLDVSDVRKIPHKQLNAISSKILNLFSTPIDYEEVKFDDLREIKIDDITYRVDKNFESMETGAYIDIVQDILPSLSDNLHKLMAVLYRPVHNNEITTYSEEEQSSINERADIFLKKMPYIIIRQMANFMLSRIEK